MSRKYPQAVSSKPENQVTENLDPFEELTYRAPKDIEKVPFSARVPAPIANMIESLLQDPAFPWKNRQDFIVAALFRLCEDAMQMKAHPLFDDTLAKLRAFSSLIQDEEVNKRTTEMCQKLADMVSAAIGEKDLEDARRLLLKQRELANVISNRRWREKILKVVDSYGPLGRE